MRRISMATRDEFVRAVSERYGQPSRVKRGRILDEFAAVTGLHRKHAMRLLRGGTRSLRCSPRPGRRVYDVAEREALIVVWEASDRVCGKRLRPLVPLLIEAMERRCKPVRLLSGGEPRTRTFAARPELADSETSALSGLARRSEHLCLLALRQLPVRSRLFHRRADLRGSSGRRTNYPLPSFSRARTSGAKPSSVEIGTCSVPALHRLLKIISRGYSSAVSDGPGFSLSSSLHRGLR